MNWLLYPLLTVEKDRKTSQVSLIFEATEMQSHTFSRTRGVPIYLNGSVSYHEMHEAQPSTSRGFPRSMSLAARPVKGILRDKNKPHYPPTFVRGFHDEEKIRRMIYNRLGQTEMMVSKVAFGCGAVGGLFGDVTDSITQIVESALHEGVNFIDTAYWYGQARSESILGKVLAKIPRRAYYIGTKVGRFELDFARSFDFRADKVLESLTESLKRLKLTYLDVCFVQIHDADFDPNQSIVLYETLQALEMAKASGKIRYIGLTGYPLKKLRAVIDCSPVRIDVLMSYCHGTLNDNSLGQYAQYFQHKGIGVLNASPLAMGLLTSDGPPPWHPANESIKETVRAAVEYVQSKHLRIERIALDYAISFPSCDTCVLGCSSKEEVRENIQIALGESPLTEVEQRVRDRIMRRYLDRLDNAGWEGVDVGKYWRRLKKLGLPALATHRHSSVESLASTLNGFSFGSTSNMRSRASSRSSRSHTPTVPHTQTLPTGSHTLPRKSGKSNGKTL